MQHSRCTPPTLVLTLQAWRQGLEGGEEEQEEGGGGADGQEAGAQPQADVPAQGEVWTVPETYHRPKDDMISRKPT